MRTMVRMNEMAKDNQRLAQLQQWADKALRATGLLSGSESAILTSISGDAGFRRYFRLGKTKPAMLAVDAPPATEKNQAFVHVAQLMRQYGVHTPQVYAVDYEKGFMLIEDLGESLFYSSLLAGEQATLYEQAFNCLQKIHRIPTQDSGLAFYDRQALQDEMDLFPEWFVQGLLGKDFDDVAQKLFQRTCEYLIESALQQAQVVVHRDFHCRNLLVVENNSPGVIDFQDAVVGPVTYDLVSLLRDCYIRWSEQEVERWALQYYQTISSENKVTQKSAAEFLSDFDLMGLQRHIKVLGIFARLFLRDNKPGYLNDLPLVAFYTLSVAQKYPELSEFAAWFEEQLMPVIKQQNWYREEF